MLINEIRNKYIAKGYNLGNANNLAAEEILIRKISSSSLANNVTLKGGIVMYNLTKNARRVTRDVDFDLIRFSIDEEHLKVFVDRLNSINDGVVAKIDGAIEQLHQENYRGARVNLILNDTKGESLKIKLDIGVHTYSAIAQESIAFEFDNSSESISMKVNPCEQIFAEKLLSLARLGRLSQRYKDIYDLYYLLNNNLIDIDRTKDILNLFFSSSKRGPNNIDDLINSVEETLNDKDFANEASKPTFKWLDVEFDVIKKELISFIEKF